MKKIMMTGLLFMVMIWLVGCTFGGRKCSMVGCRRAAALGSSHCREHQGICCVLKAEGKEEPAEDTEEPSAPLTLPLPGRDDPAEGSGPYGRYPF